MTIITTQTVAGPMLSGKAASSLVELSSDQRNFLFRSLIATEFPVGTAPCETDEHCDSKFRCDATVKICLFKESPEIPLTYSNGKHRKNSGSH
jgi:hypothetical protein